MVPTSPTQQEFLTSVSYERCLANLRVFEGFRSRPYVDTKNNPTIGHGILLPATAKETINLFCYRHPNAIRPKTAVIHGPESDKYWWPITEDESIEVFVKPRLNTMIDELMGYLDLRGSKWTEWPASVREALADMAYNMGVPRLKTFKRMFAALDRGDWTDAAAEALDSKWAREDVQESRVKHAVKALSSPSYT